MTLNIYKISTLNQLVQDLFCVSFVYHFFQTSILNRRSILMSVRIRFLIFWVIKS